MRKKSSIFLLVNILFLISGCNKTSHKDMADIISVDIDRTNKVSIFDYFSGIEIVPLETNDSSLIKSIDKLLLINDNFYILDYRRSQILAFRSDGRFIFSINNKGNGPDQYLNIADFDIYNNKLSFISAIDGTLHNYDLKGSFIEKQRLPKINGAYKLIKYINNDSIVFWTYDYEKRIKFFSISENKIFNEAMSESDIIFNNISTPVFPYGNYMVRTIDNSVKEITPDCKIRLAYQWDFGRLNNDLKNLKEEPKSGSSEKLYDFAKKIYSSEIINYIFGMAGGNSKYIYAQITRKNNQINIFFNKLTKKKDVFIETIEAAKLYPLYWTENYIVGIIPAGADLGVNDLLPDNILNERNITVKKQLSEFDNPILIKYYFKE